MKTKILIWDERDLSGIDKLNLDQVWTEVNDTGIVLREIGLSKSGEIIYYAPSNHKMFGQGLFDNQRVNIRSDHRSALRIEERFEELWNLVNSRPDTSE